MQIISALIPIEIINRKRQSDDQFRHPLTPSNKTEKDGGKSIIFSFCNLTTIYLLNFQIKQQQIFLLQKHVKNRSIGTSKQYLLACLQPASRHTVNRFAVQKLNHGIRHSKTNTGYLIQQKACIMAIATTCPLLSSIRIPCRTKLFSEYALMQESFVWPWNHPILPLGKGSFV